MLEQSFVEADTDRVAREIKYVFKRPIGFAFINQRLHGLAANIANGRQRINTIAVDCKPRLRAIDVRNTNGDVVLGGILLEDIEFLCALKVQRHGGGIESNGMIGL